jgi:protoheme IX farnesyltransferase
MDRFFDEKMQRTKTRPLVQGTISKRQALSIASVLLIVGVLLLYITTNLICLGCSLCGFIIYVGLYTPIKVRSVHGTWIGSLAGATPPLVGYSAACQRLDITALLLFLVVALWQMPHFYAIAIYRLADYSSACIPVLPVAKGIDATKKHMLAYTIAFSTCCLLLYFFSSLSYFYLLAAIFCSVVWLAMAFGGMKKQDDEKWAKKMFRFSLVIIMTLSLALSLR